MKVSKRTEDQLWEFAGFIYDLFRNERTFLSELGIGIPRVTYNAGDELGWAELILQTKEGVAWNVWVSLNPDDLMTAQIKAPYKHGGDENLERQVGADEVVQSGVWSEFFTDVMVKFYDRLEGSMQWVPGSKEGSMKAEQYDWKKQPWEMTREQHRWLQYPDNGDPKLRIKVEYEDSPLFDTVEQAIKWLDKEHRWQVRDALAEGKSVPSDVLVNYPDLAKKYKVGSMNRRAESKTETLNKWLQMSMGDVYDDELAWGVRKRLLEEVGADPSEYDPDPKSFNDLSPETQGLIENKLSNMIREELEGIEDKADRFKKLIPEIDKVIEDFVEGWTKPFSARGRDWQGDVFYDDINALVNSHRGWKASKYKDQIYGYITDKLREKGFMVHSSRSLRAADWKVEMFVGDNVVGTFELEDIVDERAGVEFIIDEHLDWEAYPLGKGRYRVQISVGGREIGEWEIDGEDEDDAMFNAVDRYIDWDFMEVDSKEGAMKRIALQLTRADVRAIVDFLNKDTQRYLDYMHDNPDYANNFSDLPKQENYTRMEYGKKIEGLVKKYDMTVEELVEALEPEDATCEMFWGHTKLDEDESVVFGFYNINEEELQFDDGMDVELSVGTIGICSALAMLNDDQFARVQKETDEHLPDKAREDAARPSPNFEIYIGIDGYVAVYRDTEEAVKMIEDWARDQGKTEEEPEEE